MTDHDYQPQGNSLDDYFPREIVQFKQHTFSCAFMVRIFRVLTYMHLHAREMRLFVYQTIKCQLLNLLLYIFFLILLLRTSVCVFLIAIYSQISQIAFGIIKHLFTGYSDNSKCIVLLNTNYVPPLRGREIVGVSGDNTLAIVLIASKQVYTINLLNSAPFSDCHKPGPWISTPYSVFLCSMIGGS